MPCATHTHTHTHTHIYIYKKSWKVVLTHYLAEVVKEKNVPQLEAYDFCTASFINDMCQSLGMLNLSRKREKPRTFCKWTRTNHLKHTWCWRWNSERDSNTKADWFCDHIARTWLQLQPFFHRKFRDWGQKFLKRERSRTQYFWSPCYR